VADTAGAQDVGTKTRVFISYSRKDMVFADKLEGALKARGFEVLIDRQEIYAFEDWWNRIQVLIGQSDTVVYLLSPNSVKSEVALKEVAYAASLNKRLAPIVYRRVDDSVVPDQLRRLNFIFFDGPEQFEASADKLGDALGTDIGWVRQHTEYGEAERRWSTAGRPNSLLFRSPTLDVAEYWMASRPAPAPEPTNEIRAFLVASRQGARSSQRLRRFVIASIFTLLVAIIIGLVGWINQAYIADQWRWWASERPFLAANIWPYVLSPRAEQALKPGDTFRECQPRQQNTDYCPDMVVVLAGTFEMGSARIDKNGYGSEFPQHRVTIAKAFAVSKFELTFAEWDSCFPGGGCSPYKPDDEGWGRQGQPVINVNWDDARQYVAWLSKVTGKTYRLLTEAEYEYATRAGTTTAYPWGDDIKTNGKAMANCDKCGSEWDDKQTAPVGSFPPNKFGLYDMVGNVWEWVEDCYYPAYEFEISEGKEVWAPADGSAWTGENCKNRVVRGGDWSGSPDFLRSPRRASLAADFRFAKLGFRVARTLDTQ